MYCVYLSLTSARGWVDQGQAVSFGGMCAMDEDNADIRYPVLQLDLTDQNRFCLRQSYLHLNWKGDRALPAVCLHRLYLIPQQPYRSQRERHRQEPNYNHFRVSRTLRLESRGSRNVWRYVITLVSHLRSSLICVGRTNLDLELGKGS